MNKLHARTFLLATAAAVVAAAPAQAQTRRFDVPAQLVETAIAAFGTQADVQIVAPRKVTSGKRANALRGDYTIKEGLSRMLHGTGLSARQLSGQTFVIVQSPTAQSIAPVPAASVSREVRPQATTPDPEPAAGAQEETPEAVDDVVVTGSRLATGFSMPTPVTALSADDLQSTAPSSFDEALKQVPSLSGSFTSAASGTGSAFYGTNGQSTLNLRYLGPQRTLVLLDGARLGVTNVVNSVDVNIIPQSLIRRVDVVTGGASASYGSDAVAGVVNFILDSKFEGLKVELAGGVTSRGDAENGKFSIAWGTKIGDSSRFVAAADLFRLKGIPYGLTGREWFDEPVVPWPNPVAGAQPTTVTLPGGRASTAGYGGTITSIAGCPAGAAGDACRSLSGQQFLPGGAIGPFDRGTLPGSVFTSGGDGAIVTNGLTPDIERESLFAHFEHDLSSNVTLWLQGIYARNYTRNRAQPTRETGTSAYQIFEGNAYLPASVASVLAATPGTQSFRLSRYDTDLDLVTVYGTSIVKRAAAGAKGDMFDGWGFDATLAYQHTQQKLDTYNSVMRNLYAAADAVVNPASGEIVCRSTLAGLDPGCVPLNLFGPDAASQEASDYVMDLNQGHSTLKQVTLDFNVRGDLGESFQLGAGKISTAMGFSYRRLDARRDVDALSAIYLDGTGVRGFPTSLQGRYGGYAFYNPSPLAGSVSISEAYLELGIPLLADVPGFQSLSATLAGRLTDYSQSGLEPMWKVGANWTIDDNIRFRGTISADTRAPSVLELFNSATVSRASPRLPWSGATPQIIGEGQIITQGNPDLEPERARTYTAGVVLTPTFARGLQMSVDYYQVDIDGTILSLGVQDIVDGCFEGDAQLCSQISVNGNPVTTTTGITTADFVTIITQGINYAFETTSGLDIEAVYSTSIGADRLSVRAAGNYVLSAKVQTDCASVDLVGDIGNCGNFPRFRGRLGLTYETGAFKFFVQERLIGSGKKDKSLREGIDITENDVPATWYTDLNISYELGEIMGGESEVFFNVTNLFDQAPRNTNTQARSWAEPSELGVYDALGTRFIAGVRWQM
jgi:outer membrane receptor protein involved in Fe transport